MSPKPYPLPLLKHGCLALALLALPLPMVQSARATEQINRAPVTTDIHSALQDVGSFYFGLYGITVSLENSQGFTHIPQNNLPAYQPFQVLAETVGEAIPAPKQSENTSDVNVLIAEVVVTGSDGQLIDPDLERRVYEAITTESGATTTRSQLQQDINNIFATGVFANVQARPEDTPLGVRITFVVQPNPVLTRVDVTGSEVLSPEVIETIFAPQYGKILDLIAFQGSIVDLNEWYQGNGYVLAQVVASPQISANGVVTLVVAEGVIESIQVRYRNEEGLSEDEDGNPIRGETQEFVITREVQTEPGDVFRQDRIQADLQRVFGLGIFDDVGITLNPGENDPRKVNLILNILERNTTSIAAGISWSFSGSPFLSNSYENSNLSGLAQKIELETQLNINRNSIFIQGSTISSGSDDGRPSQAIQYNQVANSERIALSINSITTKFKDEDYYSDISKLQDLLRESDILLAWSKETGNIALELLTFNNIGDFHDAISNARSADNFTDNNSGGQDYLRAINAYENTLRLAEEIDSPAFKAISLLNQSRIFRKTSNYELSLQSLFAATDIVQGLTDETFVDLELFFGDGVYDLLLDEWQLNLQDTNQNTIDLSLLLEMIQSFAILDAVENYSNSGNHQSSLYAASSPQLKTSILSLLENLDIQDRLEVESSNPDVSNAVSNVWADIIEEVLKSLPERYRQEALLSIFRDFDDKPRSYFYESRIVSLENDQRQIIFSTVFLGFLEFLNQPEISAVDGSLLNEARIIAPRLFDTENQAWDQTALTELSNILVQILLRSEQDQGQLDPDLQKILPEVRYISDFLINNLFESRDEDLSQVEKLRLLINVSQEFIDNWPNQSDSSQYSNLIENGAKGLAFKIQADAYYQLSDYESAIAGYQQSASHLNASINYIDRIVTPQPDLRSLERLSRPDISFFDSAITEIKIQLSGQDLPEIGIALDSTENSVDLLIQLEEESLGISAPRLSPFVESLLPIVRLTLKSQMDHATSQRFYANLNLADSSLERHLGASSLERQQILTAIGYYEEALKLLESSAFSPTPSDLAEISYGLASSSLMLDNLESTRTNIEKAIEYNETSYYQDNFLSGNKSENSSFHVSLRYGYGIPYSGRFLAKFSNPFLGELSSSDGDNGLLSFLNTRSQSRCSSIVGHFACRQKYYAFYINLLLSGGSSSEQALNAFALSEEARIFNLGNQRNIIFSQTPRSSYLEQRQQSLVGAKSLREIQAEIPDDETLVLSYFLGEDSSYLWLISKNELQTYTLPPRDEIEARAREFYNLLTSPPGRVRPRTTAAAGEQLRDMILGPVADQLGQKRLVIVGDGFLQYLPFGALPNPAPSATPSPVALEGEFAPALNPLMLEHEIVYLPSASALVGLRENRNSRPLPQQELAFFANPVFSHRDERVNSVRLAEGWEPFSPEELANVEVIYSQLPETERELEPVLASGLIPDPQVQKFWGYDANLEAALSPELGQHRIVHFASHGIFNSNAPDRSGVVLSGISETGVVQSGLLSPRHAFNQMDLSATDLVVLSGCRTGLSEGQMGREGVTGLTSGLMSAGADRVVASLWSVRDDATQELMKRFYAGMLDPENPMTPAAALRAAQISMWEEARWQAPYYWAAFTLQGEWE